jgi:hypothetical protein
MRGSTAPAQDGIEYLLWRHALGDGDVTLHLLPYDLTYREIAGRLFISMNTLKTKHIRSKLEVASRSEAVAAARRRGLL